MPFQILVAFLVLLVLNLFMLFILKTVGLSLSLKIKADANRLFASYAETLDKQKQAMLEAYKKEQENLVLEEVKSVEPVKNEDFKFTESRVQEYRDDSLLSRYNKLKGLTLANLDTVTSIKSENIENIEIIREFRSKFSQDNLYAIKTMSNNMQLDVVKELINSNENYSIINEYINVKKFDILKLINHLDFLILTNPLTPTVYKSSGAKGDFIEMSSIIEGYLVIDGKKMYDYAIKKGDYISG